ncbi:Inactive dipeptidyl peptidase [Brachionus plicatilis]|uniref:Inactive dipeptidyl peptidase n=1 Tax=Brachionus plicatilis TaxID=10195 RepID=A0A3M7SNC7_BRAPC|nr:Inactive dipeptidyl peptidase [Brachionus plicatilis]
MFFGHNACIYEYNCKNYDKGVYVYDTELGSYTIASQLELITLDHLQISTKKNSLRTFVSSVHTPSLRCEIALVASANTSTSGLDNKVAKIVKADSTLEFLLRHKFDKHQTALRVKLRCICCDKMCSNGGTIPWSRTRSLDWGESPVMLPSVHTACTWTFLEDEESNWTKMGSAPASITQPVCSEFPLAMLVKIHMASI